MRGVRLRGYAATARQPSPTCLPSRSSRFGVRRRERRLAVRQGFEPWVELLIPYNGLANRRLQPLGHLTAARNLSIRQASSYENAALSQIVPEIVPASSRNRREPATLHASGALIRTQRFFWPTTMPTTDWRTLLYSHEPASTSLAIRALKARGARRSDSRVGRRELPVS